MAVQRLPVISLLLVNGTQLRQGSTHTAGVNNASIGTVSRPALGSHDNLIE